MGRPSPSPVPIEDFCPNPLWGSLNRSGHGDPHSRTPDGRTGSRVESFREFPLYSLSKDGLFSGVLGLDSRGYTQDGSGTEVESVPHGAGTGPSRHE